MRRFRADPVPDEAIRRVLAAASRSPSARGAEPWFFVVVRDAGLRGWIGERYHAAWVAAAEYTAAADADRDLRDRSHYAGMMRAAGALAANLASVPVHVLCCLDHRQLGPLVAPDGTLRSPAAAYASIFPAVQNLLLAARALGLGSTLTTLHAVFADDLKDLLAIPPAVEVVALVPLGYPVGRFGTTRRKPVEEIAFLDRWGTRLP